MEREYRKPGEWEIIPRAAVVDVARGPSITWLAELRIDDGEYYTQRPVHGVEGSTSKGRSRE